MYRCLNMLAISISIYPTDQYQCIRHINIIMSGPSALISTYQCQHQTHQYQYIRCLDINTSGILISTYQTHQYQHIKHININISYTSIAMHQTHQHQTHRYRHIRHQYTPVNPVYVFKKKQNKQLFCRLRTLF